MTKEFAGTVRSTTAASSTIERSLELQLQRLSELKDSVLSLQPLQTELSELKVNKATLEVRSALQQDTMVKLEGELSTARDKEQRFSEKLSTAESEINRLRLELQAQQETVTKLGRLEQHNADLAQQLEDLKETLCVETGKFARLSARESSLNADLEKLRKELVAAEDNGTRSLAAAKEEAKQAVSG